MWCVGDIAIGINEFRAQSFILNNSNTYRFHFLLQPQNTTLPVNNGEVTEFDQKYKNWGEFHFVEPIILKDTLSLSFYYQNLTTGTMLPYNLTLEIPATIDLSTFAAGFVTVYVYNSINIPFPVGGTFPTFSIFVEGFTTTSPVADSTLITWINRDAGHTYMDVIYKDVLGESKFTFQDNGIDQTLPITGTAVNTNTKIHFTYDRLMIAMEFTYMKSKPGYLLDDLYDQ